jgi:Winged helix DNA-binding domain
MRSLTWEEVWRRRLARHALLVPLPREDLIDAVRAVCGIHAQIMSAAELSIGVRVAGVTRQDVRAELWSRRSLVKTYGLRGTVHLFPADEVELWTAALRAAPQPREAERLAQMGLDPAQTEAVLVAIGDALDGRYLTREELGQEVARRAGAWANEAVGPAFGGRWPRWQMALGMAARAGLLCFGPDRGTAVTFVRLDQWLGGQAPIEGATALRVVFKRYLSAYGPATHRDFAQWFSMPLDAASSLTRELADELVEIDVEGHRAWLLAEDTATSARPQDEVQELVQLLPHFDCYMIGCHPRNRLVSPKWAPRVLRRGAAGTLPVLVLGGVVAGLWQQRWHGRRLEIRVEAFRPLSTQQHGALEAAVARIGAIVEAESALSLGTVDARPHL